MQKEACLFKNGSESGNAVGNTTNIRPTDSPFVDRKRLLQFIPVCARTLADLQARGEIPSIKFKRRVLFHLPNVEAALLRRQRGFTA
jgi:hypothetical protein